MTEDDLKFGIRSLLWFLYRARSFVSGAKRSYKASEEAQAFAKATRAENHLQNSSTITGPEEDQ